jgi:hypothetical protein
MLKHIVALAVIFCGAALAWMILGATLVQRTQSSDNSQSAVDFTMGIGANASGARDHRPGGSRRL